MAKNKGGAPTKFTGETIQLLEDAFKMGCTDTEACLNADISTSTLYNYQNESPKFLERKKLLKETPVFIARKSVVDGLKNDSRLALMYLERKKKDEFSLKVETEHSGKVDFSKLTDAEIEAKIKEKENKLKGEG